MRSRLALAAAALVAAAAAPRSTPVAATTFPSDDNVIVHALNRLGYGPRPGDVEKVRAIGLQHYIESQLHPDRIADTALRARLAPLTTIDLSSREIAEDYARPAIEAKRERKHEKAAEDGNEPKRRDPLQNLGLEVAFAEVGGWDTHVNQGSSQGQLATRLDDFARALSALGIDLGDRMEDIVIVTMSEFGRAVGENGNRGTDHGHGNAMLVVGGGVRGGRVYGKWPGLAMERRYEGRDLAITTDFRDVFGEIVVRHLGIADPRPIFPGYATSAAQFPGLFA